MRLKPVLLAGGLWATATLAAASDGAASGWIADARGCKVANPRPGPYETIDWSGACHDGFADGKGQLRRTANGQTLLTYDGEMKAGRYSGQGVLTTASGIRYTGGFLAGVYAGQGNLDYPSGSSYRGGFVAGRFEGTCVLSWANGTRYEGDCKSGRPEGSGQIEFANGDRYVGAVRASWPSGPGRYTWARGDSYEGAFLAGKPVGSGDYRFADGSRYEGQFSDGQPSGRGRLELADGLGYEGNFEQGTPTTPGAFFKMGGMAPEDSLQLRMRLTLAYAKTQALGTFTQFTGAGMVCRVMGRPQVPVINWKGNALYKMVATVRDGRVVAIEVTSLRAGVDALAQKELIASIERAVKSYECPGNHVFEQEFQFALN